MNLFLGMSVLSIVDIIYCFTLRLSCSIRDRKLHMQKLKKNLPNIVNVKPAEDGDREAPLHESCSSCDQITDIENESIEEIIQHQYVGVVSVHLHDSRRIYMRNIHDIVNVDAAEEEEHEVHSHSSCDEIEESENTSIEGDIFDQIRKMIDAETQNNSRIETFTETEEIIE